MSESGPARNDSIVGRIGNVVVLPGDGDHPFVDSTGNVPLEIDGHVWRDQGLMSEIKVRVLGEIDRARREYRTETWTLEVHISSRKDRH